MHFTPPLTTLKRVETSTQVEQNKKEQHKWQSQLNTSATCKKKAKEENMHT